MGPRQGGPRSRRPPAARSMPSSLSSGSVCSAARSSPDTAQLPQHVVGPRLPWLAPRETERAAVPGGRGDPKAVWSWRAVAEQRPESSRPTARVVRRHQLMLKRRQHDSQRVGRRHQLMLKRRQHDPRPRERARDSQRRGGRRRQDRAAPPRPPPPPQQHPRARKGAPQWTDGGGGERALALLSSPHRRRQSRGDERRRRRRRQRRPRPASLFTIVSSTAALIVRASAWPLHPEPASGRCSVKETNPCPWTLNTEVSLES